MVEQNLVDEDKKLQHHVSRVVILGSACSFLVIIAITFLIVRYQSLKRYRLVYEQAESYNEAGDYEKAVNTYQKALKISTKDREKIVFHIADAYIKLDNYEKAAKVLQDYYDCTPSIKVKARVEEVILMLINEEYDYAVERGNRFTKNLEYNRALQEYQKAYNLKPNESEALTYVIQGYLNNEEIDQAKETLKEARERFGEKEIDLLSKYIENASVKEEYKQLLTEADDFFCNKNYSQAFDTYEQAIELLPYENQAYEELTDAYITLQRYNDAIRAISKYKERFKYETLGELIISIQKKKDEEEIRTKLLRKVYRALQNSDIEETTQIMQSSEYKDCIQDGNVYYYNAVGKKIISQLPEERGLIVYGDGYIYAGEFESGKRSGEGSYFKCESNTLGYFLYHGSWKNDLPNGMGVLDTTMAVPEYENGKEFVVKVIGNYKDGLENGNMRREFYLKQDYYGTLVYTSFRGMPRSITVSIEQMNWTGTYVIGEMVSIEGTKDFYYDVSTKRWGVPGTY